MIFHDSDLSELEGRYPKLDVRRIAGELERWAVGRQVHDPRRLLETWIQRANHQKYAKPNAGPIVTWMRHADGSPLSKTERRNLDAYRVERGEIQAPPPEERSTPSYAAFRMAIIAEILSDSLTPGQVADRLEQHADKFVLECPSLGPMLESEIAILRASDDWRDVRDALIPREPNLPPEPEPGFPATAAPEFAW